MFIRCNKCGDIKFLPEPTEKGEQGWTEVSCCESKSLAIAWLNAEGLPKWEGDGRYVPELAPGH